MPVFGDFRKSRMRELRTSGSARGEAAHAPPLLYCLPVRQVKSDESCRLKGIDHGKCSCAM